MVEPLQLQLPGAVPASVAPDVAAVSEAPADDAVDMYRPAGAAVPLGPAGAAAAAARYLCLCCP